MIKIKAQDLLNIAVAAGIWFQKYPNTFDKELRAATKLRKELNKTIWDEAADLFIDELPF